MQFIVTHFPGDCKRPGRRRIKKEGVILYYSQSKNQKLDPLSASDARNDPVCQSSYDITQSINDIGKRAENLIPEPN